MIVADFVRALHVLLVLYMIWAPLFADTMQLMLVEAGFILLFFHWILNNDACALTLLEQKLRGVEKSESFVQSVVGPVYGVSNTQAGRVVWIIALALFFYGLFRLCKRVRSMDTKFLRISVK